MDARLSVSPVSVRYNWRNELSNETSLSRGATPQGSILGPALYSLYVNELSEVINDNENCVEEVHVNTEKLFGDNCTKCGNITN